MNLHHTAAISQHGVFVNDVIQYEAKPVGDELKSYLRAIYDVQHLKYSKFHKMDDFCKLGFLTAEYLLTEIKERPVNERVGLFLVNSYSSIDTDVSFYNTYSAEKDSIASPSLFVYTLPNILIGEISIRHKITGEHAFFLQQDFGLEFIYLYVKTLFDTGVLDAAVVGRCEVSSWEFGAKMAWLSKDGNGTIGDSNQFNEWINKKP